MRRLWEAAVWWPGWLGLFTGAFLVREIWALASGRPQDTFSAWVWRILKVTQGETVSRWSALDFLAFGEWAVLVIWLTYHFFFRKWT